jgi:hypothetical protein
MERALAISKRYAYWQDIGLCAPAEADVLTAAILPGRGCALER